MNLQEEFVQHVRDEAFWCNQDNVLIAVSGGVDSMVLAHLMNELPADLKPQLNIAHVNHQLREESNDEERFVREWAAQRQIAFYSYEWPKEDHPKTGTEAAARNIRYTFFEKILDKIGATFLLTAHHADDQAETVLMKLIRGGILGQITGIPSVRTIGSSENKLVRPLLPFTKKDLYAFSREQNILYYEDESNQQLEFSRNRYRNQVFPLLEKENTQVKEHLVTFADELSDVLAALRPLLLQKVKQYIARESSYWEIDLSFVEKEPSEWQRLIIEEALKQISEHTQMVVKKEHHSLLLNWMKASLPNSRLDLPDDWIAIRVYGKVRVRRKEEKKVVQEWTTEINESEWKLLPNGEKIGLIKASEHSLKAEDQVIYLDPGQVSFPLTIRHRKPGDRITLKGSGGTKKVKDIFIDQKIPADQRDKAYIVEDASGKIIWVIGYKQSVLSLDKITDKIPYILVFKPTGTLNRKKKES